MFSYSKLDKPVQAGRTQNTINAECNLYKMFIGIAIVAFPFSMSWVGVIAASVGVLLLALISIASAYLLLKTRNRYKDQVISDFADLGYACYGSGMRVLCNCLLILGQVSILTAYLIYLGTQGQLVACHFGFCSPDNKSTLCAFICTVIMTPAYLLRDYKSLSYYSGALVVFASVAILIFCIFDCVTIHNRLGKADIKLFNLAEFPLFLGQSIVLFEANANILNLYAEHKQPR